MAAIITAIIAATLAYTLRSGDYLVLRNGDTNAEYARFRVKEGDEFSVTFIHSVNKYPLTYDENGEMVVSGFDKEMPYLSYIVGTVSDHTLALHGKEISLRDLCGRNSKVEFSCEHKGF